MANENRILNNDYRHFNDYVFKSILQKRANGLLKLHVISLKNFKAEETFNKIENKLKNNDKITDDDIASLQLIIYTDFEGSKLEILNKARKLLERISERLVFDINEKRAIIYLFNVLSINMLNADEHGKYVEENRMILDPIERYFKNQGIEEGIEKGIEEGKLETARNLLSDGVSLEKVVKATGLSEEEILGSK